MTSIARALALAREQLEAAGHVEARLEARLLLAQALDGVSHAWLITHQDEALAPERQTMFESLLRRRLAGEPLAYVLGEREFYGLKLAVTSATLIPRPDTETLVEAALEHMPLQIALAVLDLGTGSGAIALAIAAQRPLARVLAVDRSDAALQVARANAGRLGLERVEFRHGDWFSSSAGQRFDLIVSNPPYIAEHDPHLDQGDLRHEPRSALVAAGNGLEDIRRIAETAPAHLQAGGWLMLEHGHDQADAVASLLEGAGFGQIAHRTDLAGIRRVTLGRL
jgi:release factor glutamine methyltransferase